MNRREHRTLTGSGRMLKGALALWMLSTLGTTAFALTGSRDSAIGALETVPPALQSVSAATERTLSATFSEPMLIPGAVTLGNGF